MSLVSVVIPTLRRSNLILRAVASVLNQTYKQIEIIVVVDGPDEATIDVLRTVNDPRLQVVVNPRSLTAAGARRLIPLTQVRLYVVGPAVPHPCGNCPVL